MNLIELLDRLEKNFMHRLDRKTGWGKNEINKEFSEAIKEVMVLTYSAVMKDAKEAGIKTEDN